ncbi:MAG: gluconate 2-dehydrogenase subunit 3 family protein [Bacteroidetes bacterium]|nr:MAG: gluconate 2-dehydrogenase subunit 3 family protein [Bacteroidota bacterium]
MDRRKLIKLITTGTIAVPAVIAGCKEEEKKTEATKEPQFNLDRTKEELAYEKSLLAAGKFFTDHEMAMITVLADIIIPKDDVSGSASDAKVPEFIDFIVQDMPQYQTPMRGGLRWLDMACLKRYNKSFVDCSQQEKIEMVDDIAYPEIQYEEKGNKTKKGKVKPGMEAGVSFFSLMRNFTATGFYTSQIGIKDIGYIGIWAGLL